MAVVIILSTRGVDAVVESLLGLNSKVLIVDIKVREESCTKGGMLTPLLKIAFTANILKQSITDEFPGISLGFFCDIKLCDFFTNQCFIF